MVCSGLEKSRKKNVSCRGNDRREEEGFERERERKGGGGRRERKEERYICDKGAGGGLIEEG